VVHLVPALFFFSNDTGRKTGWLQNWISVLPDLPFELHFLYYPCNIWYWLTWHHFPFECFCMQLWCKFSDFIVFFCCYLYLTLFTVYSSTVISGYWIRVTWCLEISFGQPHSMFDSFITVLLPNFRFLQYVLFEDDFVNTLVFINAKISVRP